MSQSISLLESLLLDESGAVLSAELALVGTMGVVGATVGLSAAATSVQEELAEVASAFRSLDQSYSIPEQRIGGAWTAGSSYAQPVAKQKTPASSEEANHGRDDENRNAEQEPHPARPSL